MNKNEINALKLFDENHNCSQAVLATFGPNLGINFTDARALAAGFGAGMGYQGKTCGAVSGAYMVLGLISSKKFDQVEDIKENTYQLIKRFNDAFMKEFKTLNCNELLDIDISKEEGLNKAIDSGIFKTKCPLLVKKAVDILNEYA